MKLAEVSIKRPSVVIVMLIVLIFGGLFSYTQLNYELIPSFEVKVVTVATPYPGASPAEVENTVSREIEDAVSSLESIKKIETKSFESLSLVTIQFNNEADVDFALNEAQRKINAIRSDLPEDIEEPSLSQFSLSDMPILSMGITGDLTENELYDLVDQKIQPEFSRLTGVAQVNVIGGQEREIRVNLDPNRLEGYGLTIPQVQQMITASNLDFPTGSLKTRENSTLIRLAGKINSVEELRNLVIASQNGQDIRLTDVAEVQDTQKEVEKLARVDRQSTLLLQVQKQTDANAVTVSELVQEKIIEIEQQYTEQGVNISLANDSSVFTLAAANSVIKDLLIAVALVAFVMLFFLHSYRNALIVMVAIPTSLIATFIGMYALGYSLNLMSLLALSLVVGILVDDAIVVIENIHRHMEMGKNKVRAAYDGAKEIGFTVTAITLVIVVVFLPIAMSSGLVSDIIRQFAATVIISTMLSLLVSFTVVPWLFSRYGKLEHISQKSLFGRVIHKFEAGLTWFTHEVTRILNWCLDHKISTFVIAAALFVSSIALVGMGYIGSDFFPGTDKGEFLVQLEIDKDASIEEMNFATQRAEEYLDNIPEVASMITTVGQSSDGGMGAVQAINYKSEINVTLVDKSEREDKTSIFAAKLKRKLENELVGVKIKTVPVGLMGAEQAPLQMIITAGSMEEALAYAKQAEAELKTVEGATEIDLSVEEGNPEIAITVDRDRMASLGLNVGVVGQSLRTAFSGDTDNKFRTGSNEYDINIILDEAYRNSIEDVRNITYTNNAGQQVKLSQFADIQYGSGPSVLERFDRSPSVTVMAQNVGKTTGAVAQEWEEKLANIEKPKGVNWTWGGNMENQSEGFGTLGIALLAAIILVYLIMVVLYDDFVKPFIVLFSIPLSFIGALWALGLTNQSLNIFTILGIIMLIGLVAKNAILLVDFANHRMAHGEPVRKALIQANHARLRPILMTTIAMVFGMLPIALASGAAAEMNNGLAIVIIGGLLSSLFLTLVIVPVVYLIVVGLEERFSKHKNVKYEELIVAEYDHVDPKHEYEF
ncbi:efflux RND transporter permease subunit [Salegentibacter salegens]|uniref:Hydrophobic/amphiphilic exporter-1, HAE1 family n=1 Tax=Salegentibacter salegens TaxID=143223 RepID=A0A1M7KPS5_9FLAO|nr:efflux RND transporter permease subunit [Salegentibacter salegens]PRX48854.1 HAE1 family hydrophobic/amphiphilic exporter-1 [Salegentibacter salegens]SHM67514.1 hydrophobic/amphiphilic exporter-1, HAE1 family [Salegentibacter salegens]